MEKSLILIKTGALGSGGLLRAPVALGERGRLLLNCAAGRARNTEPERGRAGSALPPRGSELLTLTQRRARAHPPGKPGLPSLPAGLLRRNALRWRNGLRGSCVRPRKLRGGAGCAGAVAAAGAGRPPRLAPAGPSPPASPGRLRRLRWEFQPKERTGGSRAAGVFAPAPRYGTGMRRRIRRQEAGGAQMRPAPTEKDFAQVSG